MIPLNSILHIVIQIHPVVKTVVLEKTQNEQNVARQFDYLAIPVDDEAVVVNELLNLNASQTSFSISTRAQEIRTFFLTCSIISYVAAATL
jgi:hypothetical protein